MPVERHNLDPHEAAFIEIDAQTLPIDEAVSRAPLYGWGTIVSCTPGRLAYYYDEGGARRMILHRTT